MSATEEIAKIVAARPGLRFTFEPDYLETFARLVAWESMTDNERCAGEWRFTRLEALNSKTAQGIVNDHNIQAVAYLAAARIGNEQNDQTEMPGNSGTEIVLTGADEEAPEDVAAETASL